MRPHDTTFMRLLGSRTRATLIERLVTHPQQRPWLRDLARNIGTGMGAIQRELRYLVEIGFIRMRREAGAAFYQVNTAHPLYEPLRSLVAASKDTDMFHDVLRRNRAARP